MKVGGVELHPSFCNRVFVGTALAGLLVSSLYGFSAAIFLITIFCFGAGIVSISLDLGLGQKMPLTGVAKPVPLLPAYECGKCRRKNCTKHLSQEPWLNYLVPVEVDNALEDFFESLVENYLYRWYRELSYEEEFVQEVRHTLRHVSSALAKRLHSLDVTGLITRVALPTSLDHLDAIMQANAYKTEVYNSKINKNCNEILNLRDAFLDYCGPDIHPSLYNRSSEVEYVRHVSSTLLPYLLPRRYQMSRVMFTLMEDIVSGAVLQPLLDLLADPDTINLLVSLGFSPEPSRCFPPGSGEKVEILKGFIGNNCDCPEPSALHLDLSAILNDPASLFALTKFLKEEGSLGLLQFCLSVEDFNKRVIRPELSDEELANLHQEAVALYDRYFAAHSDERINVSQDIAGEIFSVLSGPSQNVAQLRTTTPLFRAYEEVYNHLETSLCPKFYCSREYFLFLLGNIRADQDAGAEGRDECERSLDKVPSPARFEVGDSSAAAADGSPERGLLGPADIRDGDETLTGSSPASHHAGSDMLEYRDLSAWRVSIPRLTTSTRGGKVSFVYVIDVQRIDIVSQKDNGEDLQWSVERRYSEFYALESKLTEFHGEFTDLKPPQKSKIFFAKDLDVMQSKMKPFEEYLKGLLLKPSLKGSDLLFTFLTSPEEFTIAASDLGLGKMIKNVPMKLTKERGQGLQPFIDSFMASTLSQPSKPRYDSVLARDTELDLAAEQEVKRHSLFEDNFSVNGEPKAGPALDYFSGMKTASGKMGVYDIILHLAAKLFKVTSFKLQIMALLGTMFSGIFDDLVDYAVSSKLSGVLCCGRLAFLCRLTKDALRSEGEPRTDEEKLVRRAKALGHFQRYLKPWLLYLVDEGAFVDGTKFIFDALQDPVINKQLVMTLLDSLLTHLFPEIVSEPSDAEVE